MKTSVILLADGFEETEALVPADILRRAGVQLRLAHLDAGSALVRGAHGIKVEADISCAALAEEIRGGTLADAVFCPGGMPGSANLAASADVSFILQAAHRHGKIIAAICAAPAVVLAPLGLLDGKKFTCYPGTENLTDAPSAKPGSFSPENVVLDGNLLTSRGPATAADLAFVLAELLCGKEAAVSVKKGMLF